MYSKDKIHTRRINPNRFITNGYNRSSFLDIQNNFRLIPNEFVTYLENRNGSISVNNQHEFNNLINRENFEVTNAIDYKPIKYPSDIETLLIVYSAKSLEVLCSLKEIIISHLIINVKEIWNDKITQDIKLISKNFPSTKFSIISEYEITPFDEIVHKLAKLNNLKEVYLSIVASNLDFNKLPFKVNIKQNNENSNNIISLHPSKRLMIEAQFVNTYLNKRIFINGNGDLCLSEQHNLVLGNINQVTVKEIRELITLNEVQKYWQLTKDEIDVCKDCEFRKACIDFRKIFQRPNEEWYHKIECNYNPYIAKWEGEEGYRSLLECGVITDEKEFSIDHEKIAKINAELWSE